MPESCLYFGHVMHHRLIPVRHRFVYRVFSLLIDLDQAPDIAGRSWLLSHNRFNLFSLHDRDHGERDGSPPRPWVERRLAAQGLDLDGGRIFLLCFPRLLGYVFNPLSVYYCYHRDGRLAAMVYEVKNTFGEQHAYAIPVEPGHDAATALSQSCAKTFYVSPFIAMKAEYRFRLEEPGERLALAIRERVEEGRLLIATITGRRAPLDDRRLLRALLAYPLMTLKVILAIHWQALRLWRKGLRLQPRPAAGDAVP